MQIRVETRRGGYHQPLSDDTSSPFSEAPSGVFFLFFFEIAVVKALTELQIDPECFVA